MIKVICIIRDDIKIWNEDMKVSSMETAYEEVNRIIEEVWNGHLHPERGERKKYIVGIVGKWKKGTQYINAIKLLDEDKIKELLNVICKDGKYIILKTKKKKIKEKNEVKILYETPPNFECITHRIGVWDCPECGQGELEDVDQWYLPESLKAVVLKSSHSKANSAIVISECQKCFKKSWVHRELKLFINEDSEVYKYSKKLIKALKEELKERVDKGKKQWEESLCKTCKVKKTVEWDCLYPFVNCGGFIGGATKECKRFYQ